MTWSITLGRIAGTAVRVHLTFFLLLAFVFASHWRQGGTAAAWDGVIFFSAVFLCVLLHEFGHVAAAARYGIRTPDVTLWPFGGVASLERMPERPSQELVVALAGPAVNIVIALLLVLILGANVGGDALDTIEDPGQGLLARLAAVNVALVVFNMIPAFPMDGGRVLRALLAMKLGLPRATEIAAFIGQGIAVALAVIGFFVNPMLILIGAFVFMAAAGEAQSTQMKALARGLRAQDAMVTALVSLPDTATLDDAVEALISTTQREFPVVAADGAFVGLLTRDDMIRALKEHGAQASVAAHARREIPQVPPWQRLDEVFRLLQSREVPAVAVLDPSGRLAGLVTSENVGEMLMIEAIRPGLGFARRP